MLRISVIETTAPRLRLFAAEVASPALHLYAVRREFGREVERRILEGTNRWKPLSERYAKWKRKRYGEQPILKASGNLVLSYKRGGYVEGDTLYYGSNLIYAWAHQNPKKGSKLPKRAINTRFAARTARLTVQKEIRGLRERYLR